MGTKTPRQLRKGKPKLTREDRYDIAIFKARRNEPRIPYVDVVKSLINDGLL